jgi:hypothetical protein
MIADGLWVPYSRPRPRVHLPRYRRDCLGELVQITEALSAVRAARVLIFFFSYAMLPDCTQ